MSLLRRAVPLEDQIALDRLLGDAFAPARLRTASISAARVRARVAWERQLPVSRGWRAVALLGRLGEASLGLGLTAILFAGSLGGVGVAPAPIESEERSGFTVRISAPLDDLRFLRMLRLGMAAPVVDDLDPATALRQPVVDDGQRHVLRELQGLLR